MAEVVGVVTGAAGLVSLSIQLLESARKLEQFYSNYRDAPKRLSRLADDIRTLSLQLKLADTDICPHDGSDWAKSLEGSIQRCRSSSDDIVQAVVRLTAKSAKYRKLGRIAVAFREDELGDLCDELEAGKSSLILALALHSDLRRRQENVQRQLENLQLQTLIKKFAAAAIQSPSAIGSSQFLIVAAHDHSAPSPNDDAKDTTTVIYRRIKPANRHNYIKISFASWLTGKTWLLGARHAESGWDVSLRTINIVSWDAPVFDACKRGDLPEVRRLITSGRASTLDTICKEQQEDKVEFATPLEFAANRGHNDICHFLMSAGRRPDQWDVSNRVLIFNLRGRQPDNDIYALLLADLMRNDDLVIDSTLSGGPLMSRLVELDNELWRIPRPPEHIKILVQNASEAFFQWPLSARLQLSELLDKRDCDPVEFLKLFNLPQTTSGMQNLKAGEQQAILKHLLGGCRAFVRPDIDWYSHWLEVAQTLADESMQTYAMHYWLFGSSHRLALLRRLRIWLHVVSRRGVNLSEYGRLVATSWPRESPLQISDSDGHEYSNSEWNIVSVTSGPQIEDWSLQVETRRYVTTWALHRAPGSWPEHAVVPQKIWGAPTDDDLQRGRWIEESQYGIYGKQRLQLDDGLDIYARLCAATQDDCGPSIVNSNTLRRPQDAVEFTVKRSSSQSALHVQYERAEYVYESYIDLVAKRLKRSIGWPASRRNYALGNPSLLRLVRDWWQDRVQDLPLPAIDTLLNDPRARPIDAEESPFAYGLHWCR